MLQRLAERVERFWERVEQYVPLQREIFGDPLQQWGIAAAIFLVALFLLRLVIALAARRARRIAEDRDSELALAAGNLFAATKWWFLLIAAAYLGALALDVEGKPREIVQSIAIIALVLQGGIWGSVFLDAAISQYIKRHMERDAASVTTMTAVAFLGKLVLWSVVVLLILDNVGVEVTALIAGLGIGGVAVALAAQNILGDLFASLSIVLDQPFVLGDFIIIGDFLGNVERIGLKTTRLRSLSGEQLIFSNNDLLQSRIRNYKRMFERRIAFSVGVTYQTSHAQLSRIPEMLRSIVEAQPQTRFDRAHFKSFGDFALVFEIVYYVLVPDYNVYMDIQQAINLAIYERFEQENIEFAYPTQTIHLRHEETPVPAQS